MDGGQWKRKILLHLHYTLQLVGLPTAQGWSTAHPSNGGSEGPLAALLYAMPTGLEKEKRKRRAQPNTARAQLLVLVGTCLGLSWLRLDSPSISTSVTILLITLLAPSIFSLSFPTIPPYETRGYTNERCVRGLQLQHAAHLVRCNELSRPCLCHGPWARGACTSRSSLPRLLTATCYCIDSILL